MHGNLVPDSLGLLPPFRFRRKGKEMEIDKRPHFTPESNGTKAFVRREEKSGMNCMTCLSHSFLYDLKMILPDVNVRQRECRKERVERVRALENSSLLSQR